MNNISSGGAGGVAPPSGARGLLDIISGRIGDALTNGTSSYSDIDNGFSGGGHDGNGSPQSTGSLANSGRSAASSSGGSIDFLYYGSSGSSGHSHKKNWDYYESPLAKKYHFGKATAYQEALANTAHRREIADLKKAGINPSVYYGAHSSSGANANIYPREASSGGSSGGYGYGGYGRGGNSGKYLFSGGAYYGLMAAVGAIAAIATRNVGAGMAASGLAGTAMKAFNGFFRN